MGKILNLKTDGVRYRLEMGDLATPRGSRDYYFLTNATVFRVRYAEPFINCDLFPTLPLEVIIIFRQYCFNINYRCDNLGVNDIENLFYIAYRRLERDNLI